MELAGEALDDDGDPISVQDSSHGSRPMTTLQCRYVTSNGEVFQFVTYSGVLCTYSGVLCTYSGVLCMHSGVLCTYSGVLCTYSGVLCTYSGVLCTYSGVLCMHSLLVTLSVRSLVRTMHVLYF